MKSKKKKRKQEAIVYGCICFVFYILSVLVYIHYKLVVKEHPLLSMADAVNMAISDLTANPFRIFPLPHGVGSGILTITVLAFAVGAIILSNITLRRHDNPEEVGGDAKWNEDLINYNKKYTEPLGKKEYDDIYNAILAQDMRLSMRASKTRRNLNMFIVGGSGAGKSFNIVGPNAMQANCSYAFSDPSGGLYDEYGGFFENNGYRVKVLNLSKMHKGNHYNPFRYIHNDKDIEILVSTLITNTTPPESHGEAFWEKCETALLVACIAYLFHYRSKAEQNFSTVMKLLRAADVDENDSSTKSPLDRIFDEIELREPDSFAVKQYKTFKMGAGKTLKSILISVAVRLQTFDLVDVMEMTNTDDIDLESFIYHKTALFLILPTGDNTFNFIASMLESQLFDLMYRYCEDTAKYTYVVHNGDKVLNVFTAKSLDEADTAKQNAEDFLAHMQRGSIEYDKEKKLYFLKDGEGTRVDYRGEESWAKEALAEYKSAKVSLGSKVLPSNHGMCMPWHVRFMMDEFANVGKIPAFQQKVSTIRKYEISTTIIVQSITQIKNMYKDDWSNIIGNCDTTIYLGGGADVDTFEWLSKLLGKETITVMNMSLSDGNKGGSTSYNKQGIELMSVSRLRTLPEDQCVLLLKSLDPFVCEKYNSLKHPARKYVHSGYEFDADKANFIDAMDNPEQTASPVIPIIKETVEEKEQREEENEKRKQAAIECANNMDAAGEEVIEDPKDINDIADRLNVKTESGIKEAMETIVEMDDIGPIGPDEFIYQTES